MLEWCTIEPLYDRFIKLIMQSFIILFTDKKQPFFLYMAFQHTHHPQFAGKMFTNSSVRGMFGDALVSDELLENLSCCDVRMNLIGKLVKFLMLSKKQEYQIILLCSSLQIMGELSLSVTFL